MTRTRFKDWQAAREQHDQPVCILGAGTSMNQYTPKPAYFEARYREVIGCNWVYMNFKVHYTVAVHRAVVKHHCEHPVDSILVYSKMTALYIFRCADPAGCYFRSGLSLPLFRISAQTRLR